MNYFTIGVLRMRQTTQMIIVLMCCMILFSIVSGCGHFFSVLEDHPLARQLLEQLNSANGDLTRFKGIARLKMIDNGQTTSGRIALAALLPDKIRVALLNPLGQPVTSLSGNGKYISIFLHNENKNYHVRQSAAAIERLIHIPIKVEDLQEILLGRVPVPTDNVVQVESSKGNIDILAVMKQWRGVVSKLVVDRSTSRVLSMESFNKHGNLKYSVHWSSWRTNGIYNIPHQVILKSQGRQLTISMDRFWPNADMPPSFFDPDFSKNKT